jgi:hypothetical protein
MEGVIVREDPLVILGVAENLALVRTSSVGKPWQSSGQCLRVLRRPNWLGLLRMNLLNARGFFWNYEEF